MLLVLTMVFTISVYANSTTYISTLNISTNSSVTGANRAYYEDNHKMEMEITSRFWSTGPYINYINVLLQKKNLLVHENCKNIQKNCYNVGSTYVFDYGNYGTGTFRYLFYNTGISGDAFTSDYVAMTSFD
jgi:hypothetical protein